MASFPPDGLTAGYQWSKLSNYSTFIDAINERYASVNGASSLPFATPSAGDYAPGASVIASMQTTLESLCVSFVPPTSTPSGTPDGLLSEVPFYTAASWRTAAGINSAGFRRACPRQISTTSATADSEGNAAAAGQIAMGKPGSGIAFGMYKCLASGSWTAAPAGSIPDHLDSTSSAPLHCAYGHAQANDYARPFLWKELHDGIVALKVIALESNLSEPGEAGPVGHWRSDPDATTSTSYADAKTTAEANWTFEGTTGISGASANSSATLHFGAALNQESGIPIATSRYRGGTAKVYVYAQRQDTLPGFWPVSEWDDQGLGLTENGWTLYDSGVSYTADSTVKFKLLGGGSAIPAWPSYTPDISNGNDGSIRGFRVKTWNPSWMIAYLTPSYTYS